MKSAFLQVTLNFELELMNKSSLRFNLNFAHSFDFHCTLSQVDVVSPGGGFSH